MFDSKRSETVVGATAGGDCAVLRLKGDTLLSTAAATPANGGLRHAVFSAVNNIAVRGGEATGLSVSAIFPADSEEAVLKETMAEIASFCKELDIDIIGGSTEISESVIKPVISVTAVGQALKSATDTLKKADPGDSVVIAGAVALEGTAILALAKEKELLTKFPAVMVTKAKSFDKELSVREIARESLSAGAKYMHDLSQGGVFAALWEFAEYSGVGLEVDLRKIPIRQETIEICNFFDFNPYEILSGGSVVIATVEPEGLIERLTEAGITAVNVGVCTDSNDRVLINGESRRFLERP